MSQAQLGKGGSFIIFVTTPYNMDVYKLPWTTAIKISHFDLTWDTEDNKSEKKIFFNFDSEFHVQSNKLLYQIDNHQKTETYKFFFL